MPGWVAEITRIAARPAAAFWRIPLPSTLLPPFPDSLSVNWLDLLQQGPEALGQGRVDVNGPLQQRIRGAGKHDELEDLNQLAPLGGQDSRPEDPVGIGVDNDLHQPGRLVALDGPGDPGHRDLADLELVAGRPRLLLG